MFRLLKPVAGLGSPVSPLFPHLSKNIPDLPRQNLKKAIFNTAFKLSLSSFAKNIANYGTGKIYSNLTAISEIN